MVGQTKIETTKDQALACLYFNHPDIEGVNYF